MLKLMVYKNNMGVEVGRDDINTNNKEEVIKMKKSRRIAGVLVIGIMFVGLIIPAIAYEWDVDKIVDEEMQPGYLLEEHRSFNPIGALIGLAVSASLIALAIAVWLLQQRKKEKK